MNDRYNQIDKNEIIEFFILYSLSIFFVYKLPQILISVFLFVILVLFWRSKKDYFWLAFFCVIESEIGYLFSTSDIRHSFSLLKDSPFGNLYFSTAFLVVAFLKCNSIKLKFNFFLKINLILIIFYLVMQIMSFGIYKLTLFIRLSSPWLLVYIIPRLLKNEDTIHKFFRLIFAFVIPVLITQSYKVMSGLEFSTVVGGMASEVIKSKGNIEEVGSAMRPIYGIFVPFLALWGSIYYLTLKNNYFSQRYINIIMSLSIFSIFITATRSWLIASLFLLTFFILITSRKPMKVLFQSIIAVMIIFVIIQLIPSLNKQINLSLMRYETLEYFLKGDITAGGTSQRFDVRIKRPMAGFEANPIVGWGVGDEYAKYADGHVGFHNLLMSSGLIGFTFWMLLWLNFFKKMYYTYYRLNNNHVYKKIPLVLVSFAISILIIHTSAQWFGYLIGSNQALAIALLFTIGQRVYYLDSGNLSTYPKITSNHMLK